MYILNSDQFAVHYCNTLEHCEGFRSLLTVLQSVERKFISLNWKEGGILILLLIVCLFTFICFTFFTVIVIKQNVRLSLKTRFALSLSLFSHPPLHAVQLTVQMYTTPVYNGRSYELILKCLQNKIAKLSMCLKFQFLQILRFVVLSVVLLQMEWGCFLVLCSVEWQVVSDGYGEWNVVGLLFGVMWCRVTGG